MQTMDHRQLGKPQCNKEINGGNIPKKIDASPRVKSITKV